MWEEKLGVRCLASQNAHLMKRLSNNTFVPVPRFVPLDWTPNKEVGNVMATMSVHKVAEVIEALPLTTNASLQAFHAFMLVGSEDRQLNLLQATAEVKQWRSLFWRITMVSTPRQWAFYISDKSLKCRKMKKIMERAALQLLDPIPSEYLKCAEQERLHTRSRKVARKCKKVLDDALRIQSENQNVSLYSMAARIRFDTDTVTDESILRSPQLLERAFAVQVIDRMQKDPFLDRNWYKWFYGAGTLQGRAVKLLLARYFTLMENDYNAATVSEPLPKPATMGALMLLVPCFSIPAGTVALQLAPFFVNELLLTQSAIRNKMGTNAKTPIETVLQNVVNNNSKTKMIVRIVEDAIVRMLGVRSVLEASHFFENLQMQVSERCLKRGIYGAHMAAFIWCNRCNAVARTKKSPTHINIHLPYPVLRLIWDLIA